MPDVLALDPSDGPAAADAGRLMHDFNTEYDSATLGPGGFADRLAELVRGGDTTVLTAYDGSEPVGLAVVRWRAAVWALADEGYLAELYVVPARRGEGFGIALMEAFLATARERGCAALEVATSVDDVAAWHLYERFGFSRFEGGEGGPQSLLFEREL